jgi:Zn ribbon nucleic-acid-binding protein
MNPAQAPIEKLEDSRLYKLLEECGEDHELIFFSANDGAYIVECLECPYHHILDEKEEKHLLEEMDKKDTTL